FLFSIMAADAIVHLEIGARVEKFTVLKKLGEGTFGAVYKVKSDDGGEEAALKTESITMKLLAIELRVMQLLKEANSQNCCLLIDKGKTETFNYIVMKLVGQSLQDMKKMGPDKHMSPGCALSSSIQCLNALKELHDVGFLHRDIKPGNYAVGQEEKGELRRCYLLDFGMCKPFRGKVDNTQSCMGGKFRGTPRYAPLASHKLAEHARKDDIESWFYMLVDFCNASLPWKVATDLTEIGNIKTDCRKGKMFEAMMKEVPVECGKILEHIDGLSFSADPDYALMTKIMRDAITSHNLKEFPYDWEPQNVEVATPVAKSAKCEGFTQDRTTDNEHFRPRQTSKKVMAKKNSGTKSDSKYSKVSKVSSIMGMKKTTKKAEKSKMIEKKEEKKKAATPEKKKKK
ncbi:hypothetical protein PFISCL1PPCAC_29190, partial [Pristionchus fissidentatus]